MRLRALTLSVLLAFGRSAGSAEPEVTKSPVLSVLEESVARSLKVLKEKGDPPPYFLRYLVTETDEHQLSATQGAIRRDSHNRRRLGDVEVRVGGYEFDSTRRFRSSRGFDMDRFRSVRLPIEDDRDALKAGLWLETDRRYWAAAERFPLVQAEAAVKAAAEDTSADFSQEPAEKLVLRLPAAPAGIASWKSRLKTLSALFRDEPGILESEAQLTVTTERKYFASSEGASIQQGSVLWRLSFFATARAADGMDLYLFEAFSSRSETGLPDDKTLTGTIAKMKSTLAALTKAPVLEPYTGPAILSGRAAGVFFHEVFGHRIEGHRQKDEGEGQTFTKMTGQRVLPDFLSVHDDPTVRSSAGVDLHGTYAVDDEGVRARRVNVVEKGILRNFLMSRSPVSGFPVSNGHGRAQAGARPVGRQANLIVEASESVSQARLRELLIEECRKQGKPYGLYLADISGGFTYTGRAMPQVFQVTPLVVYRVYTDGRPDELVRGADLIGTPLVSFSKILAAGSERAVFNGHCGAESGMVPVAASAPSILTAQIEIQKRVKTGSRPPVLPPPAAGVQP